MKENKSIFHFKTQLFFSKNFVFDSMLVYFKTSQTENEDHYCLPISVTTHKYNVSDIIYSEWK